MFGYISDHFFRVACQIWKWLIIHWFIQLIFIKQLICARDCYRHTQKWKDTQTHTHPSVLIKFNERRQTVSKLIDKYKYGMSDMGRSICMESSFILGGYFQLELCEWPAWIKWTGHRKRKPSKVTPYENEKEHILLPRPALPRYRNETKTFKK